jgi:hypothetical protein
MTAHADLVTRITFEINRVDDDDAATYVPNAITSAIEAYKSSRFIFNETEDSFTTGVGLEEYATTTAAPNALPSGILSIDFAEILISTGRRYELTKKDIATIRSINAGGNQSLPDFYAWYAESVRLAPLPNGAYSVSLKFHKALDEETWCQRAEGLIRARAKREIYAHVIKDMNNAAAMAVAEAQEARSLIRERNLKQATGRLTSWD